MLCIEPYAIFYASLLGGVLGAVTVGYVSRKNGKGFVARVEALWNEDLKILRCRIDDNDKRCECRSKEIVKRLSTISVVKPVDNQVRDKRDKGSKSKRNFNHGV